LSVLLQSTIDNVDISTYLVVATAVDAKLVPFLILLPCTLLPNRVLCYIAMTLHITGMWVKRDDDLSTFTHTRVFTSVLVSAIAKFSNQGEGLGLGWTLDDCVSIVRRFDSPKVSNGECHFQWPWMSPNTWGPEN